MGHLLSSTLIASLLLCTALPSRAASVTFTWLGGSGSWTDPAQWDGAVVPRNTGTDSVAAVIDGGKAGQSLVTLSAQDTVDTLRVDSGDGVLVDADGSLSILGSTLSNSGAMTFQGDPSVDYPPDHPLSGSLQVSPSGLELQGGGSLRLANGLIGGQGMLTNQDNVISGWGSIWTHGLTNRGVIASDVTGKSLTLPSFSQVTNSGTIRAVDGGLLTSGLYSTIDNTGGAIEARNASMVALPDALTVLGGTVTALDDSTMRLGSSFEGTEFATDASSRISLSGSISDVTLDGQFELLGVTASGTVVNRGFARGSLYVSQTQSLTFLNYGEISVDTEMSASTLRGGGRFTLDGAGGPAFPRVIGALANVDNQVRGAGSINDMVLNGGSTEATSGTLTVHGANLTHTGLFGASPGATLEMQATVTGPGSWRADGGQIHVTGNVGTTGDIEVLHGGALQVDTVMTGGNLVVDDTGSLDVKGILRVAANVDLDGPNAGRWSFATGSSLEINGPRGTAIGDWSHWQSLEATGPKLFIQPIGERGLYLPELVIGPDGRLVLRDLRDNGHHIGDLGEAVYVDTLVFSDSLGLLNLNGIELHYNTLVGSIDQIIDVPVPEPGVAWLVTPALAAILAPRRRKLP